jgi:hypothetical protein
MRYERRLSRLEAQSDLREPGERVQLFISFVSPDGTQEADFVKRSTTRASHCIAAPTKPSKCSKSASTMSFA